MTAKKKCRECGETKSLEEFHVNRRMKDGRQPMCKGCAVAAARERRADMKANPEQYAEQIERRRAADRAESARRREDPEYRAWMAEYQKGWRANNRERLATYQAEWRKANPETSAAILRRYRDANPDAVREATRRYIEAHPEEAAAQARKASSKRRALKAEAYVDDIDPRDVLTVYGLNCYLCGEDIDLAEGMHVDHVIPLSRGGMHSFGNVRPTHPSCNLRKHDKLISELALPFTREV